MGQEPDDRGRGLRPGVAGALAAGTATAAGTAGSLLSAADAGRTGKSIVAVTLGIAVAIAAVSAVFIVVVARRHRSEDSPAGSWADDAWNEVRSRRPGEGP